MPISQETTSDKRPRLSPSDILPKPRDPNKNPSRKQIEKDKKNWQTGMMSVTMGRSKHLEKM